MEHARTSTGCCQINSNTFNDVCLDLLCFGHRKRLDSCITRVHLSNALGLDRTIFLSQPTSKAAPTDDFTMDSIHMLPRITVRLGTIPYCLKLSGFIAAPRLDVTSQNFQEYWASPCTCLSRGMSCYLWLRKLTTTKCLLNNANSPFAATVWPCEHLPLRTDLKNPGNLKFSSVGLGNPMKIKCTDRFLHFEPFENGVFARPRSRCFGAQFRPPKSSQKVQKKFKISSK